jgi:TPP-dependent pyruvate/acetoin dehydrogenase alpha subunit
MTDASPVGLYRCMIRIRRFEEEVARRFRQGSLPGFVHLSIGQEAVAVGVCSMLEREDCITTTHRGHGHVIAKGADLRKLAAELYGAPGGACSGLAGSMHLVDIEQGVLCAGAIVGGTIPLATGAAFAFREQARDRVAVAFFGDGAVNEGVFHECLNIASLWRLPIVYVCENNCYAEMTPTRVHTSVVNLSDHSKVYGMPSSRMDGNDAEQVQEGAKIAVQRARRGEGPTLLECLTYRRMGHYEGDPQKYKPLGEEEVWKEGDPIRRLGHRLLSRGELFQQNLDHLATEAGQEVESAFADLTSETTLTRRDLELLTYAQFV